MKITNKYKLPRAFVSFAESDYKYTPNRYSVSTLMNGATETVLKYRHHHRIEKDVSELIWAIFGTATHKVLEEQEISKHEKAETKIECKVNGSTISGIYDLYNSKTKKITDYKTTSVWKVINKDFEDYRLRGLIYAYILKQQGIDVDRAEFILLLKDHSKTKADVDRTYPNRPVYVYRYDITANDLIFIENFIINKLIQIKKQELLSDDELPGCSSEERWATPTKYALMEKGKKRAIKLYDIEMDAKSRLKENSKYYVEIRPGKDNKCENYCDVKDFCPYYKNKFKGELK